MIHDSSINCNEKKKNKFDNNKKKKTQEDLEPIIY